MKTSNKLRVLDLFSGIGGFSLGLERTGAFVTTMFCEIEPYCREVLRKHWPDVPIHNDVRTLHLKEGEVDVITGGFPCQDISLAGKGGGIQGERSGLVFEIIRLINEGKPRFVILENSPALRSRGLDKVLQALHEIGYDAEWHCIPACHLGAHHRRDRIWVVAYPRRPHGERWGGKCGRPETARPRNKSCRSGSHTVNGEELAHTYGARLEVILQGQSAECPAIVGASEWAVEPNVGRVAYGVSSRVHRIKALGNSIVPAIPEAIGYAIAQSD